MKSLLCAILALALLTGAAEAQGVKISGFPPAGALSGGELVLGDQAGVTSTFTALQIKAFTNTMAAIVGGTMDNVVVGGITPASGTFSSLRSAGAILTGGTIDNTVIGGSTPAAGTFTTSSYTGLNIPGSGVGFYQPATSTLGSFTNGAEVWHADSSQHVIYGCAGCTNTTQDFIDLRKSVSGGTSEIRVSNANTAASTQASLQLATGTASSTEILSLVDGATPTAKLATGAGVTGGITIDASAATGAPLNLKANTAIVVQSPVNVSNLLLSTAAPTISSGFGSTPSVTLSNGTAAFRVNVGTGGSATSGVIGLPTAANGWNCYATDITTQSTTVFLTKQTASSASSATIGNFNTAGAAAAWVASDILAVSCFAL